MTFQEFVQYMTEFNTVSVLTRIVLAVVLGGIIGNERGRHGRAAGLRTHILVCLGSAMTSLTGLFAIQSLNVGGDAFRISAQVVSGIGFLGVGMIMVRNRTVVTGLTTAAGMWATATIGIAVGYGFFLGAIAATILCVISVSLLGHFEEKSKTVLNLYIEIADIDQTGDIVRQIRALFPTTVSVDVIAPRSNAPSHVGILLLVKMITIPEDIIKQVKALNGVSFVVEDCNA